MHKNATTFIMVDMEQIIDVSLSPKIPPPSTDINFAQMCKDLREELRYTQEEMAKFLNVSKRTYNYWESGDREPAGHIAVWLVEVHRKLEKARRKEGGQ